MQAYLLREIQSVYRAQGVSIDDKHVEIIIAQMMRKVQVGDPGDSEFLPGCRRRQVPVPCRERGVASEAKQEARDQLRPCCSALRRPSLQSESFISAASFQETTKVLTEAALAGKRDNLVGLKENVILGHLVPTGTGFRDYLKTRVQKNVDLQAAAEEIGRMSKSGGFVDAGGPVIRRRGRDAAGSAEQRGAQQQRAGRRWGSRWCRRKARPDRARIRPPPTWGVSGRDRDLNSKRAHRYSSFAFPGLPWSPAIESTYAHDQPARP